MDTTDTTKPGYATTEFWLTVAAYIVGTLLASGAFAAGGIVGQVLGFAGMILAGLGYTYQRASVKNVAASTAAAKAVAVAQTPLVVTQSPPRPTSLQASP